MFCCLIHCPSRSAASGSLMNSIALLCCERFDGQLGVQERRLAATTFRSRTTTHPVCASYLRGPLLPLASTPVAAVRSWERPVCCENTLFKRRHSWKTKRRADQPRRAERIVRSSQSIQQESAHQQHLLRVCAILQPVLKRSKIVKNGLCCCRSSSSDRCPS